MAIDTTRIKKRLNQHRRWVMDCDALRAELEFAKDKFGDVKALTYDAIPSGRGYGGESPTESVVYKVIDIEEKIAKNEIKRREDWAKIEAFMYTLKPTEHLIVKLRYCYAAEWGEVCKQVFGRRKDYEEEYCAYLNKVFKMHGRALLTLAERSASE